MPIKINYHNHANNSGFGNKLFLSFFARALSLETKQPLFNWLDTNIYPKKQDYYNDVRGVEIDRWNLLWPYTHNNAGDMIIVGKETNIGQIYGNHYHQNLISNFRFRCHGFLLSKTRLTFSLFFGFAFVFMLHI